MFFSNRGQVYWLKVHEIPQGGRATRGKPIVHCIAIRPNEQVTALVPVRAFTDDRWLMFATRKGTVKKTVLSAYGNPRSNGINAINIDEGDELIEVQLTDGNNDIVLATRHGMSIRFHESDVRAMGRATSGVKGIELEEEDAVIGMVVIRRDATLLVVSQKGFGKRSELSEYRVQKRGGKGIITFKNTDKTGVCVALKEVQPQDELMMITRIGVIIRVPVDGIRVIGRNTQGVRVMNLDAGDVLVEVARVVKEDEEGQEAADEAPRRWAESSRSGAKVRSRGLRRTTRQRGEDLVATTALRLITREDLARTAAALDGIAVRTPLVESAALSRRFAAPVWVKCEQHQPIGAFKIRGAYTAISRLSPEERARGIITHSSGNHGQAVAWVAKHFGIRAVIVMPETAPAVKVDGIRRHGAEIVFTTRQEREARTAELLDREGLVLVPPYDNVDVIMGQGTCAYEILEDQPEVATIVCPIGGGGMLAGTCRAVSAMTTGCSVYAVEPDRAPSSPPPLEAGHPVPFDPVETLADGLVPPATGELTLAYIKPVITGVATLSEDEMALGVQVPVPLAWGSRSSPRAPRPSAALLAGKITPRGPHRPHPHRRQRRSRRLRPAGWLTYPTPGRHTS